MFLCRYKENKTIIKKNHPSLKIEKSVRIYVFLTCLIIVVSVSHCHATLSWWCEWPAFRDLNMLLGSSPGFCCVAIQCISIFLLVSFYTCIIFQIWPRSILVWDLSISLNPSPLLKPVYQLPALLIVCKKPDASVSKEAQVQVHVSHLKCDCNEYRCMAWTAWLWDWYAKPCMTMESGTVTSRCNHNARTNAWAHPGGNPIYPPFSYGQCTCISRKCVLNTFPFAIAVCRNWARTAFSVVEYNVWGRKASKR